ncbi:response regulator [Porticoccaceae bacterium]|nr:response regulator [Porticoccaceae bacterium]
MNNSRVNWQVLIVDDEKLIHDVLSMNIRDMLCNDRPITLIKAYSANEAKNIIDNNPDIAVIILDVMMEQDDAGLNLVKYIREELKNIDIRILLHTGQPGIAPKREVSEDYMIDAYLDKNMSDNDDCYVAVKLALKSYQENVSLRQSVKKDDVTLLGEIASIYNNLLDTNDAVVSGESLLTRVSEMVNLAQEILASYSLNDIKNDLSLGSTKKERLSHKDYSALIRLNDIKMILSHSVPAKNSSESSINFNILQQSAELFSEIKILPDSYRQIIQKNLQGAC